MAVTQTIGNKPVMFKNDSKFETRLDKVASNMGIEMGDTKMTGITGAGGMVLQQYLSVIKDGGEIELDSLIALAAPIIWAMQGVVPVADGVQDWLIKFSEDDQEGFISFIGEINDELLTKKKTVTLPTSN